MLAGNGSKRTVQMFALARRMPASDAGRRGFLRTVARHAACSVASHLRGGGDLNAGRNGNGCFVSVNGRKRNGDQSIAVARFTW